MPDEKISKCRSCNQNIIWVENKETGKKTPIDAKPLLVYIPVAFSEKYEAIKGHQNHFVTCPDRDKWRKDK